MSGWIKLHRKLLNNDMYKNLTSRQRDVLITCLLLASHKNTNWEWQGKVFTCKPGQFITSLNKIQELCSKELTYQNLRTAVAKLEKWQFLTNKSTKTGRLITILNWDTYQQTEQETNRASNRQLTDSQQTANRQLTTIKNVKKNKKDKNKNKPLAPDDKKNHPKPPKINFNFETSRWENIKPEDIKIWAKAYPACNMKIELAKMVSWLLSNPSKKKSNYKKFINNWLTRAQDRGGTRGIPDKETWAERSEKKNRGKK